MNLHVRNGQNLGMCKKWQLPGGSVPRICLKCIKSVEKFVISRIPILIKSFLFSGYQSWSWRSAMSRTFLNWEGQPRIANWGDRHRSLRGNKLTWQPKKKTFERFRDNMTYWKLSKPPFMTWQDIKSKLRWGGKGVSYWAENTDTHNYEKRDKKMWKYSICTKRRKKPKGARSNAILSLTPTLP